MKDFQQLTLIKRHISKRKVKTKIVSCKTIREKNGVACSTRNSNLNFKEYKIASKIYYLLKNNKKSCCKDLNSTKKTILKFGVNKIDYLEILNIKTLKKPKSYKENFKIFISYYLGKTRLIDNI